MSNPLKCKLLLYSSSQPIPTKALYRVSYYHSDTKNSLLRVRDGYSECKIDQTDGSFYIDVEALNKLEISKGYVINIYFYCLSTDTKSKQGSISLCMWSELNTHKKGTFNVYEQGYNPVTCKIPLGIIEVEGNLPYVNETYSKMVDAQIKTAQSEIEARVIHAYDMIENTSSLKLENASFFQYVNDTKARLPVLFFPLMSLYTGMNDYQKTSELFSNVLQIAKFNCRIANDVSFDSLVRQEDFATCACITQEFFTQYVRCLQYKDDTSSNGKNIDRWSVLSLLQNTSRESFDCEDGARMMMDIFCVLMKLASYEKDLNSELWDFIRFVSCYTPFFCICDINVKNGTAVHVLCILADTSYIESVESRQTYRPLKSAGPTQFLPSIHLESTHHSLGSWNEDSYIDTVEEKYYHAYNESLNNAACNSGVSRHMVKLRAPIQCRVNPRHVGHHKPLYSSLRVLMSPMYKGHAVQFLATESGTREHELVNLKVPIEHFMKNLYSVHLEVLFKAPIQELEEKYSHLFSILPSGHIPNPPKVQNSLIPIPKDRQILANIEIGLSYYMDKMEEYDTLIADTIAGVDEEAEKVTRVVRITEDLSIIQFWVLSPGKMKMMKTTTKTMKKTAQTEIALMQPKQHLQEIDDLIQHGKM
jgi:hypothetical protein